MAGFATPDYQLTGEVTECPGVSADAARFLGDEGVRSTFQLIGRFLNCDRNPAEFANALAGCPNATQISEAVSQRVANAGVKIVVSLPASVDGKPISSRVDDVKAQAICARAFNNDMRHDFEGCGLGKPGDPKLNQSMQSLHAHGITSTNKLFGEMLMCLSGPPTTEMLASFWKRLGALGVAAGWKSTLLEAMKLKLDIGLDNRERPHMERLVEEPARGTDEQIRRRPRAPPDTPPPPFRGPDPEPPAPPRQNPTPYLKISIAVVLLGVAAAVFFAPSQMLALGAPPRAELEEPEGQWL